jgi:hypothetical protein
MIRTRQVFLLGFLYGSLLFLVVFLVAFCAGSPVRLGPVYNSILLLRGQAKDSVIAYLFLIHGSFLTKIVKVNRVLSTRLTI